MPDKKVLEIKNVSKVYKNRTVLNALSFDVYAGEIFGFLGPNGAGKTTLIRAICGLTELSEGEILICGHSVTSDFSKAIANLGAMLENSEVYSYMTGYQNLNYYANLYGKVDHSAIDEIVEMVGMSTRIHDKVRTYSYGMRQRLALAQSLLHRPKLLVLDEPTNGLDANGVIELRQTLKILAAKNNMAILVSSHILSEMEQLCNTVAIVDNGNLLELRSMDYLKNEDDANKRIAIRVDYPNYACKCVALKLDFVPEIAGNTILIPFDKTLFKSVVGLLKSKQISVYGARVETKKLEELYLEILKTKNYRGI